MKVRIDGVEYDVSEQAAQAIQKEQARHDGERLELEKKLESATQSESEAKGRADAAEAKLKEVEKQRDDALDPEKVRTVAKARATLESEAKSILGEDFKLDELTDSAIRKEVVSHVLGDRFDSNGSDESYIAGAYRVAVDQANDARQSHNDIADAACSAGTDGNRADEARKAYLEQQAAASKEPLTAHKG